MSREQHGNVSCLATMQSVRSVQLDGSESSHEYFSPKEQQDQTTDFSTDVTDVTDVSSDI